MADYTNWLKNCVYRAPKRTEALYQGQGPGNTSLIFYGAAGLDEQKMEECFARYGGRYGQRVEWLFAQRGQILVSKWRSGVDENTLVLEGLGAGADDVRFDEGDVMEILTKPHKLQDIADILELEDIPFLRAEPVWMPRALIPVQDDETIRRLAGLMDEMTAMDGICNVTADFTILDEKFEKILQ